MRTSNDLVIVYSPVGGGHKAAALALAETARARGQPVTVLDAFDFMPRIFGATYVGMHMTGQAAFPALYGPIYSAADRRGGALEPVRRGFDHIALAPLVAEVIALRPRAVIATHHLPLVVLGRARRLGTLGAPLVGIVTDYTSHAAWAERGVDAFAVACPRAATELAAHGVDRARVAITGMPIKAAFHAIPEVSSPMPGEALRVLITSGGFGVGPLRRIVRALRDAPDVALTIVCGAAHGLRDAIDRDVRALGMRARVLGFERDMPARMAEAHVVVGKSGGLTVSETLAAGRPMVVVGAVPGNETKNEAFVVEGDAGVSARAEDVALALASVRDRGIAAMGKRARALVPQASAAQALAWTHHWAFHLHTTNAAGAA